MTPSVRALVATAHARLAAAGIEANEAAMDAALLARHLLGWDLARFVAHETDPSPDGFPAAYDALVDRRASREPISVILGRREFWGLEFEVTPAVLAPRPETEIVLEAVIERCGSTLRTSPTGDNMSSAAPLRPGGQGPKAAPLIVDVGTGSGCLAVCLAGEFPDAQVVATDISAGALEVAQRNAVRHGVAGRLHLVRTSLLDGLAGRANVIVSNPPYVPAGDMHTLPPEVRDWEPRCALDGGADGLDIVRALLADAPRLLVPDGWLVVEFGFGQEQGIRDAVAAASRLELVEIRTDLQGIPRTLVAASRR